MRQSKSSYWSLFVLLVLAGACKTSGELHSEGGDDPANIRTVSNPVYVNSTNRDPVELERELQITKGQLEEVKYLSENEKRMMMERIAKLEESNAQLVQELEKLQWNGLSQSEGNSASTGESTAQLMWTKAIENLNQKEYDRAESLFASFVKTYPKDQSVFYAKVAQAMIYYNQGKYRQSLISFNKVIDEFPKHERISLAWFGQGAAFAKNGQKNDAKLFFEEALRKSSKSTEAKLSDAILKKNAPLPDDLFQSVGDWNKGAPYSSTRS